MASLKESPGKTNPVLLGRLVDWGDHQAWGAFVACYTPLIESCCRHSGLGEEASQELGQQIWIELADRLRTFRYDPTGSFRGWLRRLCRSRILDRVREQKIYSGVSLEDFPGLAADYLAFAPERSAENDAPKDNEDRTRLLAVAASAQETVKAKVDPETWQAFWMVAVEDRSVKDAAEYLGKSYAATFVAQKRVKERLRVEARRLMVATSLEPEQP